MTLTMFSAVVLLTTLTAVQATVVVYGLAGSNVCPQGYAAIGDAATCRAVSDEKGLRYRSSDSWSNSPVGCLKETSGRVTWFNTHSTGAPRSEYVLVCIQAPTTCPLTATEYGKSDICLPENIQAWESQTPVVQKNCPVDEYGFMKCEMQASCKGGDKSTVSNSEDTHSTTYDCLVCDKQEDGTLLRPACCATCEEQREKAAAGELRFKQGQTNKLLQISEVTCTGCTTKELDDITKGSQGTCTVVDGVFSCDVGASCEIGDPQTSTKTEEFKCTVTPCDVCTDRSQKADCCSKCLTEACGKTGADQRYVCRGCEWRTPAPAPAVTGSQATTLTSCARTCLSIAGFLWMFISCAPQFV